MTTPEQKSANAANAKNSTGPKSAAGKAKSSQIAKSHGLTTPPAEEEVVRWVRIITEDVSATAETLGDDDLGRAIWDLATARAKTDRARRAERLCAEQMAHYAGTHLEQDPFRLDLDDLDDPVVLGMLLRGKWDKIEKEGLRILLAINSNNLSKLVKRLETIQRYVREAERHRKKAFTAYITLRKANFYKTNPNTSLDCVIVV